MTPTHVLTKDFLSVKKGTLINVKKGIWSDRISGQRGGFISPDSAYVKIKVDRFPNYFKELTPEEINTIQEAKELLRSYNITPIELSI